MASSLEQRIQRASCSLEGLSVGDAFGETFFINPAVVQGLIEQRSIAAEPWYYTDDTEMAVSIVETLSQFGAINTDDLAQRFAQRYDPNRGYGPAMHRLLLGIRNGEPWAEQAANQFSGQGSYGNGSAMRVAPLGAFFADDLPTVVEQSKRSSIVTHTHEEAIAGAIAVAVAAAIAWQCQTANVIPSRAEFLDRVLPWVPFTEVSSKIRQARNFSTAMSVEAAVSVLGNGTGVSAQDTVPFALWCAATHLNDYESALWMTVSGLGDRDTTCAIVGGIVAMCGGVDRIPRAWRNAREALC